MAMLHTVNKSPFERGALRSCLRLAADGSTVLLLEDAVVAALDGTECAPAVRDAGRRLALRVLGPDLAARGLAAARVLDGVEVIDYPEFVELAATHDSIQSWL